MVSDLVDADACSAVDAGTTPLYSTTQHSGEVRRHCVRRAPGNCGMRRRRRSCQSSPLGLNSRHCRVLSTGPASLRRTNLFENLDSGTCSWVHAREVQCAGLLPARGSTRLPVLSSGTDVHPIAYYLSYTLYMGPAVNANLLIIYLLLDMDVQPERWGQYRATVPLSKGSTSRYIDDD
uniref:Uncharacterized protein n=1 Tax=Mycena chlorophos TaxID=658473 RepID=A0ABQ0M0A6_MYCCL|nr:predicted protein [Mycena chlorophos]